MTLLKDNNYKEINVALLSLEADIKNKITNIDTSVIDRQLAEINSRIDKINAGGNNSSATINDIRAEIEDINSKLNGNSAKIEKIEQKLSDIFSAENKVTDFNTTTDSGIYYWVTDAANRPTDYGVLLVNKYDGGDSTSNWVNQVAYGTNNKIYFRQNINSTGWTEWKAVAYLDDIEKPITKGVSLSTVAYGTTKYVKLGTFHWYDSFSFRCRIAGNSFEDNVNINILGGISIYSSVCGYYSTNSALTKSIIVKRGDAWNSDFEIYLKIVQLTTADVYVTIDKAVQDRINISESTTAPSGTLEEIVFSNVNGMFTSNIDAKNISGKANFLDEYVGAGGTRLTSGNIVPKDSSEYGGMRKDVVTDSMTDSGRPGTDGHLLTMFWDNPGRYDSQFFVSNNSPLTVKARNKANGADYGPWVDIATSAFARIPIGAPSSLEDGCIWIER